MSFYNLNLESPVNSTQNHTQYGTSGNGSFGNEGVFRPFKFPMSYAGTVLEFMEFRAIAVPVLGAIGFFLNILIIYIFCKTKLRNSSSSKYIVAIASSDLGVIGTNCITHLRTFDVNVYRIHGSCQIIMYINHMTVFLSVWYVAALVIEKFIGLYWPKKKTKFCTTFRAKCVISGLAILSVVFYHFITWTVGLQGLYCLPWTDKLLFNHYMILMEIDSYLVAVVPLAAMLVLSWLIAIKSGIYYFNSRSPNQRTVVGIQRSYLQQEKEFKTTPMVLSVALCTVGLSIPNSYVRLVYKKSIFFMFLAMFLQFLSNVIKPLLYFLTSARLRSETYNLMKRIVSPCFPQRMETEMQNVSQQTDDSSLVNDVREGKV